MNFIESALKYKQVTLSVLFLCFAFGIYSLLFMSRREDPKITVGTGLVIAYYPGASSTQVEEQVTKKLEQYLFKFDEVKKASTTSSSQDGKVVITVELTDEANSGNPDVFWSKLRHELLIAKQLDLPQGVIGPIVNSDFGDTEAMILAISGKDIPYSQLDVYAGLLEDKLREIPAVSKVKRAGNLSEQITVEISDAKIAQYGITLQDVMKVLQSQNNIYATGNLDVNAMQVPLYTKGYYNTQEELSNQIIGASKNGSVVRLKDIATLKRTYAEETSKIKVNQDNAMIVTIQMKAGNNIVKFGEEVNKVLAKYKTQIPESVKLTTLADQPEIVDVNISHFIREFILAIISVVLVVILMLPFRIALVSAMAIPMTVALTLGLMNFFGIELHQVSLAGLIVVLGMVVDDAIVVADNYVELLDRGVKRWEAAWRSASDLIVPILVATVTIIFAFLPMAFLSGPIGEFIRGLPITVTIALTASFVVALFFTPFLCYTFIKKGLHDPNATNKKASLLDKMQVGYNAILDICVKFPKSTVLLSLIPIVLSVFIYKNGIKQKFFPTAERNQFVLELWMPTGTNFKTTEKAITKLENLLKGDERIVNYSSFIGNSAPRFYYNFSPEFPVTNYGQILINTTDNHTAESLALDLSKKIADAVPEGAPQVRLMQQGKPLKAPVEVSISGDDISFLKTIANQVDSIMRNTYGAGYIRNDFAEDYYGFDIQLKPEAERLGFTTESIAKSVYAGFAGAPITTIREGSNPVKVMLRLNENERNSTEDINKYYLVSPVTGAKIPLEQVATIVPVWQPGKIMHSNGVRTLTVQAETQANMLPSEFLKAIQPQISALELPIGYEISYGGELKNQRETLPNMIVALSISLVLIFLVLLFQFKTLKESLIIMATIPLSLFGAVFGLYITGNNFGFTAFVGIISLSGVVVRNAIILIDHIHELVKHEGMDLRAATIESGKRRLRPIFLTAMAAAIGVLPMIISASPMWSPLASVIAVGVVWSMFMALLTVPALYLLWVVPKDNSNTIKAD